MTNIGDIQTRSICYLNLISSSITLLIGEPLQITCDMFGCTTVQVVIGINSIAMSCRSCLLDSALCLVGLIKAIPALKCIVAALATNLTLDFVVVGCWPCWWTAAIAPSSATSTTMSVRTTRTTVTKRISSTMASYSVCIIN
jgi:hypothetical protein